MNSTYTDMGQSMDVGQLISSFGILSIFIFIVTLAASVIYIGQYVAMAVMLIKARQKPWKAIVPVYNQYMLFKIAWSPKGFILAVISFIVMIVGYVPFIALAINSISTGHLGKAGLFGIIMFIGAIASFVVTIIFFVKLSKAFDKSGAFAIGLLFFYPIFMMILGFGRAKYVGPLSNNRPIAPPPAPVSIDPVPKEITEEAEDGLEETVSTDIDMNSENDFAAGIEEDLKEEFPANKILEGIIDDIAIIKEQTLASEHDEIPSIDDMPISEEHASSANIDEPAASEYDFYKQWTPQEEKDALLNVFGDDSIPVPAAPVSAAAEMKSSEELLFGTPFADPVGSNTAMPYGTDKITEPKPINYESFSPSEPASPSPKESWLDKETDAYRKAEEEIKRRRALHQEAKEKDSSFSSQIPKADEDVLRAEAREREASFKSFHDEMRAVFNK